MAVSPSKNCGIDWRDRHVGKRVGTQVGASPLLKCFSARQPGGKPSEDERIGFLTSRQLLAAAAAPRPGPRRGGLGLPIVPLVPGA